MKPKAIICDLDGTLCDDSHRKHFVDPNFDDDACKEYDEVDRLGIPLDETKFEWYRSNANKWQPDFEAYYNAMGEDKINEWCMKIIKKFDSECKIFLITGRPEKYRSQTVKWLFKEFKWVDSAWDELFMRPDYLNIHDESKEPKWVYSHKPDHRPSHEVKREIYEREIKGKYEVLFCLEDDPRCVEMYRSLGLVCLDVGIK